MFDAARALTTVTKVRINYEIAPDGKTLTGTTEAVVFDPTGKVINARRRLIYDGSAQL